MGRKSFKDEIQIVKYLTALAPQTFEYIEAIYKTGDKPDKKWAIEQMIKLYGKAMPQAGDDEKNPIFTAQITGMEIIHGKKPEDPILQPESETDPSSNVLAG
jgi:hypothetical protein